MKVKSYPLFGRTERQAALQRQLACHISSKYTIRYGDPFVQKLRNRNPHKSQRAARFVNIEASARPEWVELNAAATLDFLVSQPGNRLEVLKRAHKGQRNIRINDQFRVCFVWTSQGPTNVEI